AIVDDKCQEAETPGVIGHALLPSARGIPRADGVLQTLRATQKVEKAGDFMGDDRIRQCAMYSLRCARPLILKVYGIWTTSATEGIRAFLVTQSVQLASSTTDVSIGIPEAMTVQCRVATSHAFTVPPTL